jgi:hypothetical protein
VAGGLEPGRLVLDHGEVEVHFKVRISMNFN